MRFCGGMKRNNVTLMSKAFLACSYPSDVSVDMKAVSISVWCILE